MVVGYFGFIFYNTYSWDILCIKSCHVWCLLKMNNEYKLTLILVGPSE